MKILKIFLLVIILSIPNFAYACFDDDDDWGEMEYNYEWWGDYDDLDYDNEEWNNAFNEGGNYNPDIAWNETLSGIEVTPDSDDNNSNDNNWWRTDYDDDSNNNNDDNDNNYEEEEDNPPTEGNDVKIGAGKDFQIYSIKK